MKNKILLFAILTLSIGGCTSSSDFDKGKEQLETMGYTDVKNTGHKFFCCSNDESYSTGFRAKNKKGIEIEGCFCSEIEKGVTIRFK